MLDPRYFGHQRPGAGRDQDLFGGHRLPGSELDRIRASQLRAFLQDGDLMGRQRVGVSALDPSDLGKHIVAERRPVEPAIRHVPAEHRSIVQVLGKMRAVDQQLLRHTAADDAGAADPVLLGDCDTRAVSRRNPRSANAA
jgi:hypothetical protein